MGHRQQHPHILQLLGYCRRPPALVYEFMENGDLESYLKSLELRSQLSLLLRIQIMRQIAEALSHLHSNGVVHRDIKPANILLRFVSPSPGHEATVVAKVSDLGLSRLYVEGQTRTTAHVAGTLPYMDPIYNQTFRYTKHSDVYSFGVVLF